MEGGGWDEQALAIKSNRGEGTQVGRGRSKIGKAHVSVCMCVGDSSACLTCSKRLYE